VTSGILRLGGGAKSHLRGQHRELKRLAEIAPMAAPDARVQRAQVSDVDGADGGGLVRQKVSFRAQISERSAPPGPGHLRLSRGPNQQARETQWIPLEDKLVGVWQDFQTHLGKEISIVNNHIKVDVIFFQF
jgi:hypothetical protein